MSLDLANRAGRAHNTTPFAAADLTAVTSATFDSGDLANAGKLLLQVSTAGGDIDAGTLPTSLVNGSMQMLEDGVELTIVKNSTDTNLVTFTDPLTGIAYGFVNRQGESITLVFDTSTGTGRWLAKL